MALYPSPLTGLSAQPVVFPVTVSIASQQLVRFCQPLSQICRVRKLASSHLCMLARLTISKVAALSQVMRVLAKQGTIQRQPLGRLDHLRALSGHNAPAASQVARRPTCTMWGSARGQCSVQCRARSSSIGPNGGEDPDDGIAGSDGSSGGPKLSEDEPGVQRQEDDSRPAEARPDIAAAAAAASRDDTDAGAAEQPSEAPGLLRPLLTYREVLFEQSFSGIPQLPWHRKGLPCSC